MSADLFKKYKPLRNSLRQTEILESLHVVWGYVLYLQIDKKELSGDIEIPKKITRRNLPEWELKILTREILINSKRRVYRKKKKSLKKYKEFKLIINKLKEAKDKIQESNLNSDNALIEFFRIKHKQFKWQENRLNRRELIKYYKIYNTREIDKIFQEIFGLSVKDVYKIGFLFITLHIEYFKIPTNEIDKLISKIKIDEDKVNCFLNIFSKELNLLREKVKEGYSFEEDFLYSFFELRSFPIIKVNHEEKEYLACPLPTLLFWELTNGIYYKVLRELNQLKEQKRKELEGNFNHRVGKSFENYIGEVLEEVTSNKFLHFRKEKKYETKEGERNSIDWVAWDKRAVLFIECKTKKLGIKAKHDLNPEALESKLNELAEQVVLKYQTIYDLKKGLYSYNFNLEEINNGFLLFVMAENWYLNKKVKVIEEIVRKKVEEKEFSEDIIDQYPFSICSAMEFERLMQIINKTGINSFMEKKFEEEKVNLLYASYMLDEFNEKYENTNILFTEIFNEISLDKDDIKK